MSNGDDLYLYLLNENNKYVPKKFLEDTLKRYGVNHKIKDMETFQRAFIHTTYLINDPNLCRGNRIGQVREKVGKPIDDVKKAIPLQKRSYERLEFIGDARIHDIIGFYLFKRYPTGMEGFLTKLRTKLENKPALAGYSKLLGFDKYVMISKYMEVTDGRNSIHVLEDAFESFVGALALESDYETCERFLVNFIEANINMSELIRVNNNYKDILLRYHHQMGWGDPKYDLTEEIELDEGKKKYKMHVKNNDGNAFGYGTDNSKQKGEQLAARDALVKYKQIRDVVHDSDDGVSVDDSDDGVSVDSDAS